MDAVVTALLTHAHTYTHANTHTREPSAAMSRMVSTQTLQRLANGAADMAHSDDEVSAHQWGSYKPDFSGCTGGSTVPSIERCRCEERQPHDGGSSAADAPASRA
jgi:hypothetical protein